MTQAKAQACASAIIAAGYGVVAFQLDSGAWVVKATASSFSIPNTQIDTLVSSQAVSANAQEVEFS